MIFDFDLKSLFGSVITVFDFDLKSLLFVIFLNTGFRHDRGKAAREPAALPFAGCKLHN